MIVSRLEELRATSQASCPGVELGEQTFQDIFVTVADFAQGVEPVDRDSFKIVDRAKFMREVERLYKRSGHPLHPLMSELIFAYMGGGERLFARSDGIPGLHAEVRAVNSILNRLTANGIEIKLNEIQVATYRLTEPGAGRFSKACANCSAILKDTVILTGTVDE